MSPEEAPPRPAPRPGPGRWQFGLRAAILLVVAAALGSTVAANRRRVAELAPRIDRLRPLARELDVVDPAQFAAIRRRQEEPDAEGWDLHIPAGRAYRVCLATRGIDDSGPVAPRETAPLAPGRHTLRLVTRHDERGSRFEVLDGPDRRLAVEEPNGWASTRGSGSSTTVTDTTHQAPAARPLVLIRRRYMRPDPADPRSSRSPDGPSEGVMLWVEPVGAGPTGAAPR